MNNIAESELIINERGGAYHLNIRPEEISHNIILVGDPDRVGEVSRHFDSIDGEFRHREFVTHCGYVGKKRLSVVSTGIGTDNIDIVLNELDALVNIDFDTRLPKAVHTQLQIIRIGTSGSLQKEIPVDSLLASTFGLGIDNLLNFYIHQDTDEEIGILDAFSTHMNLGSGFSKPYISSGSRRLLSHFNHFHQGITVTCPGFYAPQGRVLRAALSQPGMFDAITNFRSGDHRISNFEMETAGIYGLSKVLGHEALSLNAILANRITGEFTRDAKALIERLITESLEIIEKI
ncbi:MAG: phosphorylase [Sphingobacteriaceae bacterium]|jgi:uridine phosphorylase|nr:phosphorylase [Sphingobacteriaceae bacterium]